MKWVTFISLFFLFSSAYSRGLVRREAYKSEIAHRYNDLGEEHFRGLVLVAFSQYLQQCPFEDHVKLAKEVTEFAKACAAEESGANCDKSLHTLFGDKLCTVASLRDKYGDMADCCEKQEPDRNECFLAHKDALCAAFQDNEQLFLGKYLYEIARRHPYFYAPELLYYAQQYKGVFAECCQAADKAACLGPKIEALREKVLLSSAKERFKCASLQKFGDRAFKAWSVARLSQRFPKADFAEISKVVTDLTKVHKECCHGDLLECADDRADLAKYMCENQDSISTKLKECCDKPVLEKSQCLAEVERDELPGDLPSLAADFVEDKEVCKNYQEAKDVFLGTFLYEYSRRHSELAVPVILRVDTVYQNLLAKCCKLENPLECYSHGKEMFQRVIRESHERVKNHCDLHEKLGDAYFHDRLIILYTKKAPQLSAQELVMFTKNMAAAATKCCPLRDEQQFACMEDLAKLILGALCRRHEAEPINAAVGHCCDDSYAFRKPCFDDLQVDRTYISPPLSCDQVISLKENLCKAQEEEFQTEKQKLLSNLVKQKPYATEMQFQSIIADFSHLVETCCQAESSEMCFREEGSKLIEKCQSLLGGK
uniref:Albumin n=1 Tax=Canis lupus familiaris TaxID=9615 RepID=A0A8C0QMR7_CANLF